MPAEMFVERRFSSKSRVLIEHANAIIASYQAQGFTLTLRQLYYQFVSRDIIPNKQSEYKRLGSIINDARLAGLVDWDAIEDRERYMRSHSFWESPEDIIQGAAASYREDIWDRQQYKPEVWIEKSALLGVIEPACRRWRVPFTATRGYTSQSAQYDAGKRFANAITMGFTPVVLHLGDHDPSGIDMTRDNTDRLEMFAREGVEVRRLALNIGQVRQYNPPPNPAKETDSRVHGYKRLYGSHSWELDALDPTVIDQLISSAIEDLVDREKWDEDLDAEQLRRDQLSSVANRWDEVERFITNLDE